MHATCHNSTMGNEFGLQYGFSITPSIRNTGKQMETILLFPPSPLVSALHECNLPVELLRSYFRPSHTLTVTHACAHAHAGTRKVIVCVSHTCEERELKFVTA